MYRAGKYRVVGMWLVSAGQTSTGLVEYRVVSIQLVTAGQVSTGLVSVVSECGDHRDDG